MWARRKRRQLKNPGTSVKHVPGQTVRAVTERHANAEHRTTPLDMLGNQ
jgi:hypothetical protein